MTRNKNTSDIIVALDIIAETLRDILNCDEEHFTTKRSAEDLCYLVEKINDYLSEQSK